MSLRLRRSAAGTVSVAVVALTGGVAGVAGGSPASAPLPTPGWGGFAADAQHTAASVASPQPLTRVRWSAPVDLHPVTFPPDGTFAHYASPLITSTDTVVVPTRIGTKRGFELVAYAGSDGTRQWRMPTDYDVPTGGSTDFPPPGPPPLVDDHPVAIAGGGGGGVVPPRGGRRGGVVPR